MKKGEVGSLKDEKSIGRAVSNITLHSSNFFVEVGR